MEILQATIEDLPQILDLQKLAYLSEAKLVNDYSIQPLTQTLENMHNEFNKGIILKAIDNQRIIGSIRAYENENRVYVGKLIVHSDYQNKGTGSKLLLAIETYFNSKTFELFTSSKSEKNLHIYKKYRYKEFKRKKINSEYEIVFLEKGNDIEL